ncbi:MAG: 30S ribosomal protein S8e [Candidatus Pacearchaeota archaeon]|nr:30S ribosomal protein S8e [Candidatus Pacearchaeota archaeon]
MKQGRKTTGGKYHLSRKKKLYERKGIETKTVLGELRKKTIRVKGGNKQQRLLRADTANIIIDKKAQKTEIKNVIETPQNNFLARQNRLMKGAIIETSKGKARITNRPGREGFVNAVLIRE